MTETKRVIVTGATGLIGSSLCQALIRRGYAVIVFSRDPIAAREQIAGAVDYIAWQPWIHIADAAGLSVFALEDQRVRGALNGTAPDEVRNRDFAHTLGQAVGKPARLATPGFFLRMWLGVTADTIIYGRRVLPKKALDLGYQFQFATLESAFRDLLHIQSN